jgi:two-component system sensor histidine kinase UhpB
VPGLCAVARVLGGVGDLPSDLRERCHDEVTAAMLELRAMLLAPGQGSDDAASFAREVRRWRGRGADIRVARVDGARVPPEHDALVCAVVREALRNALRHGTPSEVRVGITAAGGVLGVSVVNDGASRPSDAQGFGLGLRLAAAAAAERDGSLTWGPEEEGRWQVRLTVPLNSG